MKSLRDEIRFQRVKDEALLRFVICRIGGVIYVLRTRDIHGFAVSDMRFARDELDLRFGKVRL